MPAPLASPAARPQGQDRTADLLRWYDRHRRALPWRALPGQASDPYAVWLSEIMLQQTTVEAVKPFYARFLAAWPSVEALGAASLDDVLRAWAGLGYYSRARNLHACARLVVAEHGGRFPGQEAALRRLPGIGAYTAAAVAAIAFGQRAAVVDGNVERVIARLDAIDTPLPQARVTIRARMDALTPADRPGDFAQATMDLGATICTPRNPACAICPLAPGCTARRLAEPTAYPVKAPRRENPMRYGAVVFVQNQDGDVLVRTRPAKGLLGGMTELPGTAWGPEPLDLSTPASGHSRGTVRHTFTHFTLMLDVFALDQPAALEQFAIQPDESCRWVPAAELDREALPTLMRNALALARREINRPDPPGPASRKRRRS